MQPVFDDPAKFDAVETFTIVTGYGKSRTRGRRHGNDGMKKRVQAMLGFMGIEETPQENAGRVRVNKDSLRAALRKNNGRIILDVEGYMAWSKFSLDVFSNDHREANVCVNNLLYRGPRDNSESCPRRTSEDSCPVQSAESRIGHASVHSSRN